MKEWDYEKNKNLDPKTITNGSNKKVWWKCNKEHKYISKIAHRVNGSGCPYCSNTKVLKGYNDLKTKYPKIAKEWNYEKNKGLTPEMVMSNSHKKVWWKCNKGHEWEVTINSRVRDNTGCPYCSNKKVLRGYNDLATTEPKLAEEWSYEKNKGLTPEMVTSGSNKKVWWKCNKGHEWNASIYSRKIRGCPICRYETQTSFNEQCIYYYLRKIFPNCITRKKIENIEVDVYIENLKLGIEYDGENWHKNAKKDERKVKKLNALGVTLINIREPKCPKLNNEYVYQMKSLTDKELEYGIKYIVDIINKKYELNIITIPNISRDRISILELYANTDMQTSLGLINPKLAEEWNYEKNGRLTPYDVKASSTKKVWWKCNKGHEWEATIASRNEGNGCPYCSNKKVLKSYNDLATTEPKLAKEWNYEKNKGLTPEMVTFGSSKKVWWICEKGHEWEATIGSRSSNHGCPYCSNKKVLKGYNDLATINPKLAKEWNYEKNQFLPSDILPFSNKKVWWKCNKCGYEWQYKICHRSNGYGKCPYCSGKYSVKGETDLKKQ